MEDRYMRYFKIHWLHSFTDEPEYIFSEIDEEGYEVRKVEIFKNGNHILYSNYDSLHFLGVAFCLWKLHSVEYLVQDVAYLVELAHGNHECIHRELLPE